MITETHPAVSDAMREAVARILDPVASAYGDANYYGPQTSKANASARLRVALKTADAIFLGPIASEIARLTGERGAAREALRVVSQAGVAFADMKEAAEARAEAAEAETARLHAALEDAADALGWAGTALSELDAYAAAGVTRSAANNAGAALSSQEKTDA